MLLTEDSLRGRAVISADGQIIGTIKSILVDSNEWRVASVSVAIRKEVSEPLGIEHGMFHRGTIEIPVRLFQSVGETAVLGVPLSSLRELQRPAPTQPAPVH